MKVELRDAIEWALLPPEQWDAYPPSWAEEHKRVLRAALDEGRESREELWAKAKALFGPGSTRTRIVNTTLNMGLTKLEDTQLVHDHDLLKYRNFGRVTLNALRKVFPYTGADRG